MQGPDRTKITERLLDRAAELETVRHYASAAHLYRELWEMYPGTMSYLFTAGLAACAGDDYPSAIESFGEFLKTSPDHYGARRFMNSALCHARRDAEALEALEREVARYPFAADAWDELGQVRKRLQQFSDAVPCFAEAARITPKNPEPMRCAALCLEAAGRGPEAIAWYGKLAALDPSRDDRRLTLVLALIRLERYDEAIRHCDASPLLHRTPRPEPGRGSVFHDLKDFCSISARKEGDPPGPGLEGAEKDEDERAFARGMENILFRGLEEAGSILRETRHKDLPALGARDMAASFVRVHDYYSRVLEKNPRDICAHIRQGLALMPLGRIDEALACYNKALEIDPWSYPALKEKSVIFHPDTWMSIPGAGSRFSAGGPSDLTDIIHMGRWLALSAHWLDITGDAKATRRWFENLTVQYPENDDLWVVRGLVRKRLFEDLAEAEECFLRALGLNPRNTDAMVEMAGLKSERRDFAGAHSWFDRALATDPASRGAQRGKTRAYLEACQLDKAWACYQEFIRQFPDHTGYFFGPGRSFSRDGAEVDAMGRIGEIMRNQSLHPEAVRLREAANRRPAPPVQVSPPAAAPGKTRGPHQAGSPKTPVPRTIPKADDEDTRYSLEPENPAGLSAMEQHALVLEAGGRREEAIRYYDDQINASPSAIGLRIACILALVRQERYDEAIRYCRAAAGRVAQNPFIQDPGSYSSLTPLSDLEEFCRYQSDITRNPAGPARTDAEEEIGDRVLFRGFSCILAFQFSQVIRLLDATKMKDLPATGAREMEASFLRIAGYFDRRIGRNNRDIVAIIRKGRALDSLGRKDEAQACYNQASRVEDHWVSLGGWEMHRSTHPFIPPALPVKVPGAPASGPDACTDPFRKGRLLALAGRREEALRCLDGLVATDTHPASYWVERGIAVKKNAGRDLYGAIWCYERALAIDPRYMDAMIELGTFYSQMMDFAEAHAWFDRALAIDPSSVPALENKARAYNTAQRYDEAAACYGRCLRQDPSLTYLQHSRDSNAGLARIKPWPRRVIPGLCTAKRYADPLKPPGSPHDIIAGTAFDVHLAEFHNHFLDCGSPGGMNRICRMDYSKYLEDLVKQYPNLARRYVAWSCSYPFISGEALRLVGLIGEALGKLFHDDGPRAMIGERIREIGEKGPDPPAAGPPQH